MAPEPEPELFARAVAELRSVHPRPEIVLEDAPAPGKLAPYAFAIGGTVSRAGVEVATGRLILLHDPDGDRKSTRLNSSHVRISYAVFCLKKKKKEKIVKCKKKKKTKVEK